ncbi:hypothetical protein CDD81_2367 [Ophiocordyceps australis]|uniref:Uncharacterized protein n=1 Tax=Ophiocordyceps australis TaxID=1399860 RepID=A0A2C5XWY8_9HYPO|nr:hypothetical protein CDD81_2367 [Ophiocordyceps australis]
MAKPRLIILIRHAQSEGNKHRAIHQTVPDHRVKLTPEGCLQAADAGRRLRSLLRPDDSLQIFTSPYRRTRETTDGIIETLTCDDPQPSPFSRADIKVYEEPRLREQDFGNFQPCSAEMERMWQERADYGHFFYRIPNGESAADAYDRISGFNESLWRQFGDDDFPSVCILVTHGLMSRVFLMKWYHFTVEYFEDLRNVNHCEFLIMRHEDNGKYLLENKLRTWSELRRERATSKEERAKLDPAAATRRWGGCPNGCNHSSHYKKHHDLDSLRQRDSEPMPNGSGNASSSSNDAMTIASRRLRLHRPTTSDDGDDEQSDRPRVPVAVAVELSSHTLGEEVLSSPDGTPSFITAEDRLRSRKSPHLHLGRDFGGTYSGHASLAGSETDGVTDCDSDRDAATRTRPHARRCAFANRLGDEPGSDDTDGEHSADGEAPSALLKDLERAEKEDRSIAGSVY